MGEHDEIALIDLSSIAHPVWHTTQSEPDPNKASQQTVARVRTLTSAHPHAAICCDSGRSFRRDLSPSYKANRPEHDAPLQHQITLAREQLAADGYPVWSARGFEADDLIASGVARALALDPEMRVLVISADKDLLQLVAPRVRVLSAKDGSIYDADAVKAKYGVSPEQMCDYLTLVGDDSDNVRGAKGIGPKTAAALLSLYRSIEGIYEAMDAGHTATVKPAARTSLIEFRSRFEATRALIALRYDVDLPFEQIAADRVPKEVAAFALDFDPEGDDEMDFQQPTAERADQASGSVRVDAAQEKVTDLPGNGAAAEAPSASRLNSESGLAVREPDAIMTAPAEWERQLDPRSMKDARILAKDMHDSHMFMAYGSPQAVLSTIMLGRELGLPAMASLRQVHVIEGRHGLSAQLMVALILKSGLAEYFEPVEFDEVHATYETLRKGGRKPIVLTHTIEMARTAGLLKPDSNWMKVPTDMLVSRASSRLARMIYSDLLGALYTPEELAEIRDAQRAA